MKTSVIYCLLLSVSIKIIATDIDKKSTRVTKTTESIKIDGVRKKKCFDLSENNEVTFSGAGVVEDITSDSIIRETLSDITCVNWRGDILWSFVRPEKLRSYIFDQFSWKNNWISQLTNSAIVCLDRASGEIS